MAIGGGVANLAQGIGTAAENVSAGIEAAAQELIAAAAARHLAAIEALMSLFG